jgi:uncharacterized protein (TIGR02145 family)
MPTTEEYVALGNAVNTAWTQVEGVYGLLCTDKTDDSKTLFFPAAGECYYGNVHDVGSGGYYWSSSLTADYGENYAYHMNFDSGYVGWGNYSYRYDGFSVRGVLGE